MNTTVPVPGTGFLGVPVGYMTNITSAFCDAKEECVPTMGKGDHQTTSTIDVVLTVYSQ